MEWREVWAKRRDVSAATKLGAVAGAWYFAEILSKGLTAVLKHCNEDNQGDLMDRVAGNGAGVG